MYTMKTGEKTTPWTDTNAHKGLVEAYVETIPEMRKLLHFNRLYISIDSYLKIAKCFYINHA